MFDHAILITLVLISILFRERDATFYSDGPSAEGETVVKRSIGIPVHHVWMGWVRTYNMQQAHF